MNRPWGQIWCDSEEKSRFLYDYYYCCFCNEDSIGQSEEDGKDINDKKNQWKKHKNKRMRD